MIQSAKSVTTPRPCDESTLITPPDLKQVENKIEQIRREKEAAIKSQDFEKAAGFRDQERETKGQLQKMKDEWKKKKIEATPTVTEEDRMVRETIEDFLKEKIKGFSRFQNFKLDVSGEVSIRFQYDYSANKERSTQFIGVGYLSIVDWYIGSYTENKGI